MAVFAIYKYIYIYSHGCKYTYDIPLFRRMFLPAVSFYILFAHMLHFSLTQMLPKKDNEGELDEIHYWYRLLSRLIFELNYQCRAFVICAADYGDPQNRNRLFIVAAKRGRPLPQIPEPTHGTDKTPPHVTVKDALQDLEHFVPDANDGNGMVQLPNGKVTEDHCFAGIKSESAKLIADKPSKTVRRTNGIEHYSLERNITVREMARLQSFPDEYQFCGSDTQKKSQIGNAVPVNLATAIAASIYKTLY